MIQRYDAGPQDIYREKDGDYVLHADHLAALAAARDDAEVHRIERWKVCEMLAAERAAREKAAAEAAALHIQGSLLLAALSALLAAYETEIPAFECGREAQNEWAAQRETACRNARLLIDAARAGGG